MNCGECQHYEPTRNPATGRVSGDVAMANARDVAVAVAAGFA